MISDCLGLPWHLPLCVWRRSDRPDSVPRSGWVAAGIATPASLPVNTAIVDPP